MINIKNKSGITMTSLVIYVILLFAIITLVLIITSNFNERLFTDRGMAANINTVNKLQYYIFKSARNSKKASIIDEKITFSNGDVYTYDNIKKVILKNDSIIIENISAYTVLNTVSEEGFKIEIEITTKKYLSEISRNIIIFVRDN